MEPNFKKRKIEILLNSGHKKSQNSVKVRNVDEIQDFVLSNYEKFRMVYISFLNEVNQRDTNFLEKKMKQFKQKQFDKIYKGAKKIIESHPNYFFAYLFAGASACKIKKYVNAGPFYLSCAALNNANCLAAWDGLQRTCRQNRTVDNTVFETAFCGYLLNERKQDKWREGVLYVLNEADPLSENLYTIFAQFLLPNYADHHKALFIAEALSYYLFNKYNCVKNKTNDEVSQLAVEAFLIYCDDAYKEGIIIFYNKALMFLVHIGAYRYIFKFITSTVDLLTTLCCIKTEFLLDIFSLLFFNNLDPSSYVYQKLTSIFKSTNLLEQLTPHARLVFSLISKSFGDHRRICSYNKNYFKDEKLVWGLNIVILWSNIKLQEFETAWKGTLKALSEIVSSLNENEIKLLEKRNIAHLHLDLCLYLLTHSTNKLMQKQGLILCLKLMKENCNIIQLLYVTSIAAISLNAMNIVHCCLHKLSCLGGINEILFLKSLMDVPYPSRTSYLKEIQELKNTHLLAAVLSNKYERKSKALKSFCKASVMVPDCWSVYEWLGIYSFENHDITRSKLYFELALFYNPHSWTSINYYSKILAQDDPASSKLFLSLYNSERNKNLSFLHWVDIKAGLSFFKFKPRKDDYFKACEYFRRCLRKQPQNRYFKEMLAESYSKFGMIGSGLKCFKECYISNSNRYLYSGSMLGKQYLFVKGVTKYLKMMKNVANGGGMDVYIVLHNTAHALLLKSIKLSRKKHFYVSQIYIQQALFFCVRAMSITTSFSGIWKLMGDILFQCSCLNLSTGFLFIPGWLLPEYASKKILLTRRFQSCMLAIRCYYAGLRAEFCLNEMKVCIWNSIAVALRKLSSFENSNFKQKLLNFGIDSSTKSLKTNIYDSMSWNILGVLINDQGLKNHEAARKASFMALNTGLTLGSPVAYSLFSTCNAGFIALSLLDYEKSYKLFLSARGTYPSLDTPWVGDMLINLYKGNLPNVIQNIVYLYLLTKHSPKLRILFVCLLFLSPFCSDELISYLGKKYNSYSDADSIHFCNYFLSGMVKSEGKNYKSALIDFVLSLRTYFSYDFNDCAMYNAMLQFLLICLLRNKSKSLLDIDLNTDEKLGTLLLCESFFDEIKLENAYLELIKEMKFERKQNIKEIICSLLSIINYIGNRKDYSKYYFLRGMLYSNCLSP